MIYTPAELQKVAAHLARPPARLTLADARASLARLGVTLRKTEFGEYRVNFRHGAEVTAVYESDLASAIDSGLAMQAHRARLAAQLEAMGCPAAVATRDALAALSL